MKTYLEIPTPKLLYVHDNLTPFTRERYGESSAEHAVAKRFIKYIADQPHVMIGTIENELSGLIAQSSPSKFDIAFGLGYKGEEIAELLHGRWSSFPKIIRLDITRVEERAGKGYELVSKTNIPIISQIRSAGKFKSCAIIDDVLYTGFTAKTVLGLLPKNKIRNCHLFFTRGIEETKKEFEKMGCAVYMGVSLPGKIESDANTISAMNLITEGAIRTNEGDMSYLDRPQWFEAWFPKDTEMIMHLLKSIMHLLKSVSIEERKVKPHVLAPHRTRQ